MTLEAQSLGMEQRVFPFDLEALKSAELASFAGFLDLSAIDYMTMEDLLELGGYLREPALLFMLMNLFAAMRAGSVCLIMEPSSFLERFPSELRPTAEQLLNQFLAAMQARRYDRLIQESPEAFVPLIWVESRMPRLYFQKHYLCESDLKQRLTAFLQPKERTEDATAIVDELYAPPNTIRLGPGGAPIVRDPIQQQALILGLTAALAIVSGGPGTGKTSLMVNLLRGYLRRGFAVNEILLGAPTGRAAQRMTEAIADQIATIESPTEADLAIAQLKGATLHRMLKYDPLRHRFQYHAGRFLPVRVIIIDEVSMVDLAMMDYLVQAVDPKKTRLILLGDKNQLPSVEAGAVLADLIPQKENANRFKENLVVLETVFRSGRELTLLAEAINSGKAPPLTPIDFERALECRDQGWTFALQKEKEALPQALLQWARKHYFSAKTDQGKSYIDLVRRAAAFTGSELERSDAGRALLTEIFDTAGRSRILTLTRVGAFGCEAVNTHMGRIFAGSLNPGAAPRSALFAGGQIIVRRNDYVRELFNGDVGIVLIDSQGILKIYFQKSGLFFGYSADLLPPFEPAFALTVHQSQGSEYEEILLILPDDVDHRLLTREMLYTAVTRAQKRVLIYGLKAVFDKGVSRRIQRQTGMAEASI